MDREIKRLKILVCGHSVIDTITIGGKIQSESPGGIHFSVTGLNAIKKSGDRIYLISMYSEKDKSIFKFQQKAVDKDYSTIANEIPRVYLNLDEVNERAECYNRRPEKLDVSRIYHFEKFDGILLNMITGFDIDIADLKIMREECDGLIYLDIHTLARGFNEDGTREFRAIPNAKEWMNNIDIAQMNERELKCVSQKDVEVDAAEEILHYGVSILLVTKGALGVTVYYKRCNEIVHESLPSFAESVVSTVGCGDIFGEVFFYNYLSTKDLGESLTAANRCAGLAAGLFDKTKLNFKNGNI